MNKEQFLRQLRASLKNYSVEEIDKAVGYYDEIISDKIERGADEKEVIAALNIKDITKEIQLDILSVRTASPSNLKKTTNSAWVALVLLASPALFPISIALFVVFFTVIVTSAALMIGFLATSVGLIISLIPTIVYFAGGVGAGEAVLAAGAILVCAAVFGFLTIAFYYVTKLIINAIAKLATKLARKNRKGENI